MKDSIPNLRQQAILNAAWEVFAAYGFRKTSMDDIARKASMSRPALYLHYRNKQDIFRSLAQNVCDQACADVSDALAQDGPLGQVLGKAFKAQGGKAIKAMLTSPHGMELLDATNATAADIIQTGDTHLQSIYASWLSRMAENEQIQLAGPAHDVAGMFMSGLKGLKMAGTDYSTYQVRLQIFAATVGAGLAES